MSSTTVNLVTEIGKKSLGEVLKYYRERKGWSMDDLVIEIERITGHRVGKSTISHLERGNADPKWNTLAIIAAVKYITDKKGRPLTAHDLFDIACQMIRLEDVK